MSLEYDKKIAQKLRNLDKKYVANEDKKELVGGNVRELIDIKEGMGLEGMGLSAGMKKVLRKTKGKGMSAGAQLGYDGPPEWKDNAVPPFFRAGAYNAEGMSAGGFMDIVKLPLKLLGFGKNGEVVAELTGSGLAGILNPISLFQFGRNLLKGNGVEGSGMSAGGFMDIIKLPLKLLGLGKNNQYVEMEGCGEVADALRVITKHLLQGKQPKGKGMSAGRKGKGMSAGAVNRTGNQGLMGFGEKPKNGAGLFDVMSKIANFPSDIMPSTFSSPLEDIFGKSNLRDISAKIAENMTGGKTIKGYKGKGMGNRPTKQNLPSSSFSGGAKKPNKRAEIVRKIMKERGVGMIEASRIVKNEGLY